MSNERNENGIDPLVSDAYRELADEKTPDSLNRKVLRMAVQDSKTRYSMSRAWTRPVAWAATIGLSLVVVLRLTDLPQSDPASAPVQALEPVEQELTETRSEEERQLQQAPPPAKRSRPVMQQEGPAEKAAVRNEAPLAGADSMHDGPAPSNLPTDADALREDNASVPSFAPRNAEVRREAEGLSRMQSGSRPESGIEATSAMAPVAEAAAPAAGVADDEADTGHLCPSAVRTSAEKWSECIAALESTAPRELIEKEYEALRIRFPEFEHAVPVR